MYEIKKDMSAML